MVFALTGLACLLIVFFFRQVVLLMPLWVVLTPKAFLLIDTPALPAISVYKVLCATLIAVYLFKLLKPATTTWQRKPFTAAFTALLASGTISTLANGAGSDSGVLTLFTLFLEVVAPVTVYCRVISRVEGPEVNRLFTVYATGYCALALYGSAAYLVGFNPYVALMQSTNETGRLIVQTYVETVRGARAQGTISHPITYGGVLALFFLTYCTVMLERSRFRLSDYLKVGLMGFVFLLGMYFTNSRSPLILVGVGIVAFTLTRGMVKSFRTAAILGVLFSVVFLVSTEMQDAVYSVINIFNPAVGEAQNGSSLEMRSGQLAVSLRYFDISPLWGNGLDATRNIVASGSERDLYDSESIVFKILIDQGLLGIVAYAYLFWAMYSVPASVMFSRSTKAMHLGAVAGYFIFALATGFVDTLQYALLLMSFLFYYFRVQKQAVIESVPASIPMRRFAVRA